jgi:hypothetical protein
MAIQEKKETAPPLVDSAESAPDPSFIYTNDDMFDPADELEGDSLLPRALRVLSKIYAPYWEANHRAIELQSRHHLITNCALFSATLAVSVAILELPILFVLNQKAAATAIEAKATEGVAALATATRDAAAAAAHTVAHARIAFSVVEPIAAILALLFVGWGIWLAVQKHWLLERHKAERFRFLKYRFLLKLISNANDPTLKNWAQSASREASEIKDLEESDLEEWLKRKARLEKYSDPVVSQADFNAILDYYERKRLDPQIRYFSKKSDSNLKGDWLTRLLPPGLFLASLAAALIHFAIDLVEHFQHWGQEYTETGPSGSTVILIALAALLPVLGAAVRTLRSANEYGRNTIRFSSMYMTLRETLDMLPELPDGKTKLERLWVCEQRLEDEHNQWLGLMVEAEWFG